MLALLRNRPYLLVVVFLFLSNALLVREWFSIEYQQSMYSIESAYIGLARHYQEHGFTDLWFPHWYGGLPTANTYPPVLHWLVAGTAKLGDMTPARAYHVVTGITFCMVPVALALCAWVLSRRWMVSLAAGLLATLLSPSAMLLPFVRNDLGAWVYPRRLQTLVTYGEGPHVTSIALLFAAVACLHLAIETKSAWWRILTAGALAATVLTNSLGAAALAFCAIAYLASRADSFRPRVWVEAGLLGLLAYCLAAPQLPPSLLMTVRQNAPLVGGVFDGGTLAYTLLALHLAAGALLAIRLHLLGAPHLLRFSVAALVPLGGITISGVIYGFPIVPQPERYHLEAELVLLLSVTSGLTYAWDHWHAHPRLRQARWLPIAVSVLILAIGIQQVRNTRFYVRNQIRQGDATTTIEYQSAAWFEAHLPHGRVFVPGSISFWLFTFSDTPQFGGGYDNGVQNPHYLKLNYQIYSGDGAGDRAAEIAVTWLKAYGVRAIQVPGPDSPEVFHPYRDPSKFEGTLEPLWEHRDTTVYRVPSRHPGLAAVVPVAAIPQHGPENGLDVGEAERYVAALEDPKFPLVGWKWKDSDTAILEASLEEGQVISVQIACHPGWRARNDSGSVSPACDGLGQMVLDLPAGKHYVELQYTGGTERTVMLAVFGGGLAYCCWLLYVDCRDRRKKLAAPVEIPKTSA